jgi:hypothetical protein
MLRTMLERLSSRYCRIPAVILLAGVCNLSWAFVLSNGDKAECRFSYEGREGKANEIWNTYDRPENRNPEIVLVWHPSGRSLARFVDLCGSLVSGA